MLGGGNTRYSGMGGSMGTSMKGGKDAKQLIYNVIKEISKSNKMVNKEDIWAMI